MLSELLRTNRKQINTVADAWIAAGSTSFALWQNDKPIACWPPNLPALPPDLIAPIQLSDGTRVGELRLTGGGEAAYLRLAADAALLATLAESSIELENMTEALGETEDRLVALYQLTRSTSDRLDANQLLHSLTRQAMRLVKAKGAFVVLAPDQVIQVPPATVPDASLVALLAQLQLNGRDLLLSASELPLPWSEYEGNLFITSLLEREDGKITACLGLWLDRAATSLSPDLKLARSIAKQGGAQLEIALLHQELVAQAKMQAEMELARQVQLRLLPGQPPRVAGVDLFAESRPALRVGGDFYDFYGTLSRTTQQPLLSFSVGDVSGKGMAAALLMTMMRTTLRAVTDGADGMRTPEAIVSRTNAHLYDDFTEVGMMATVFVGQYDAVGRRLIYANAGHSPVLYCPAQGPVQLLEADGPVMGALPSSLSEDQVVPFGPGDLLAVMTDGFNEARNPSGELFGIHRLSYILASVANQPTHEIARTLFTEVERFSHNRAQDDDQTLLVVKGI